MPPGSRNRCHANWCIEQSLTQRPTIRQYTRSVLFRLGKTVNHVNRTPTRTGWVHSAALHQFPGQAINSAHPSRDMLLTSTEVEDNKR